MKASPTATKAIALTMWLVEAVLCMGFILITLLPSAPGALRVTRESWLSHDVTGMLATSFFVITIPAAAYFAAVGFRFFWRHLTQKDLWEPQKATILFMSSCPRMRHLHCNHHLHCVRLAKCRRADSALI